MCPGLRAGCSISPPTQSSFRQTRYSDGLYIGAAGRSSCFTLLCSGGDSGDGAGCGSEQPDTPVIERLGNLEGISSLSVEYYSR